MKEKKEYLQKCLKKVLEQDFSSSLSISSLFNEFAQKGCTKENQRKNILFLPKICKNNYSKNIWLNASFTETRRL